jgi:DNA-directed RNA polymerase subunit RPC12/RpoP
MDAANTSMIVDGNCLAGMMGDLFGADVTALVAVCSGCGTEARVAEAVVELDSHAAIVRCRSCTRTLFTLLLQDSPRFVVGTLGEIRA